MPLPAGMAVIFSKSSGRSLFGWRRRGWLSRKSYPSIKLPVARVPAFLWARAERTNDL